MSIPFRFLFALLLVCGAAVMAPQSARAADCVAKPGPYLAVWERDVVSLVNEAGQQTITRSSIYADIGLQVDCDGTVTVTNKPSENAAVYDFTTNTRAGGAGKIDGRSANAIVQMHYAVVGKATKGKNDFPVVTLHVTNDPVCPKGVSPPMFCLSATSENWTWTPDYEDDTAQNEIISNSVPFNAQSAAAHLNGIDKQTIWGISHTTVAYPQLAQQPGTHSGARDGFSLARSKAQLEMTVSQVIENVFLDNVSSAGVADSPAVMQTFRAFVHSWGPPGVTGKSMHFVFENQTPIDVPVSKFQGGNMALAQFDMSKLSPGDHKVTVTATNSNNQTVTGTYVQTIIPTPPWARKLTGFAGRGPDTCGVSDCYGYSGTKSIPEKKITFGIDIPDIVPIVGGPWGVKNLGFTITPRPHTLVPPQAPRDDTGLIDGSGTFGLGDKVFNIAPLQSASHLITNTTMSALLFKQGYVSFDETMHSFTKHIGLTSAVASLASLTGIKGIGQAINSADVAGVDATIGIGLSNSQIEFGAAPSDADIKITKFSTQLNLAVQMVANINAQVFGVQAVAQVNGALNLSFTPSPSVTNCKISYLAYARLGVPLLGPDSFNWIPNPPEWHDLTQCKASNTAFEAPIERLTRALAEANRGSLFATAEAATPNAGAPVAKAPAQAFAIHLPAGRSQTTLVANAPMTSAPALAAGPGGRKALVWIANGAQLRLFDGKSWQAPVAIGDGKHPDALPSVAFDGNGNVLVAWSVNETPNLSASTAPETQLASMQIETVTCDGHTGAVTSRKILSSGAGPHANVQAVAASDGSVWIAWQNLAASDYATPEAPDRLFAAHWNKAAWSAAETVASDVRGLQAWQLAARDGTNAILGYDATLAGKRTVHALERNGGAWHETFNKAAALRPVTHVATGYDASGKAQLLWADGVAVLRESGGAASTLIANAGGDPMLTASGSTLLRTPAGYSSAAGDPAAGKATAPVPVAPLTPSVIAPNATRDGNDWAVVSAPVEMTAKTGPILLFAKK